MVTYWWAAFGARTICSSRVLSSRRFPRGRKLRGVQTTNTTNCSLWLRTIQSRSLFLSDRTQGLDTVTEQSVNGDVTAFSSPTSPLDGDVTGLASVCPRHLYSPRDASLRRRLTHHWLGRLGRARGGLPRLQSVRSYPSSSTAWTKCGEMATSPGQSATPPCSSPH